MDRPGAIQSVIYAIQLAPPPDAEREIELEGMNAILGGSFTSRINMNLREDKHWSYGARSSITGMRGPRPFMVNAPVQTDKTKESLIEVDKELRGIIGDIPITDEEVEKTVLSRTLGLSGRWETMGSIAGSISSIVRYGLPDDYYQKYEDGVRGLDREQLAGVAKGLLTPDKLIWIVIGDREKIEEGIKELEYGEVINIDAEGNRVE